MTVRQFNPCKRCGGWVYEDIDRQEFHTVISHVCLNCSSVQDSHIIPIRQLVQSQPTPDKTIRSK